MRVCMTQAGVRDGHGLGSRVVARSEGAFMWWLGSILACTGSQTDAVPSCPRAYHAILQSLAELHHDAGRPFDRAPDEGLWVARCESLALTSAQLGCLEPRVAMAEPERCGAVLGSVADRRDELDALFRDALELDKAD